MITHISGKLSLLLPVRPDGIVANATNTATSPNGPEQPHCRSPTETVPTTYKTWPGALTGELAGSRYAEVPVAVLGDGCAVALVSCPGGLNYSGERGGCRQGGSFAGWQGVVGVAADRHRRVRLPQRVPDSVLALAGADQDPDGRVAQLEGAVQVVERLDVEAQFPGVSP